MSCEIKISKEFGNSYSFHLTKLEIKREFLIELISEFWRLFFYQMEVFAIVSGVEQ